MKKNKFLALTMLCSLFSGVSADALEMKDSSPKIGGDKTLSSRKFGLDDSGKGKRKTKDTDEKSSTVVKVVGGIIVLSLILSGVYKYYYMEENHTNNLKFNNSKPEDNKKLEKEESYIDGLFREMRSKYSVAIDSYKTDFYFNYFTNEKFREYVPGTYNEAYNMYEEGKNNKCMIIRPMSEECLRFLKDNILFKADQGKFDFFIGYDGKCRHICVCPNDGSNLKDSIEAKIARSTGKKFVKSLVEFC